MLSGNAEFKRSACRRRVYREPGITAASWWIESYLINDIFWDIQGYKFWLATWSHFWWCESRSVVSNFLRPPGQNTRVGGRSHLQGIFPTQGSNPGPESSIKNRVLGFPWWLRSEESACQWRRWVQSLVREDPSASEQLSLCTKLLSLGATAAEPTTPGAHARARARTREATAP